MTNPTMTQNKNDDRTYRSVCDFELRSEQMETGEKHLYVEGYAAKFDNPTVIYEADGIQYKEVIARGAFDNADLTDVLFRYNHKGDVFARIKNKTLELRIDNIGLWFRARLDGTEGGRNMYQSIAGEYISDMSFAFKIDKDEYDRKTHTRTLLSFKKIFDVSPVDIPAYANTSVVAVRDYFEAREQEFQRIEQDKKRKRLALKAII